MPTHFHFLIETTEQSTEPVKSGSIIMPALANAFRLLQSSYAKGINQQINRTGSLFQQKTKAKLITDTDYGITVFHYIHQNPYAAGLVKNVEDWPYSSFPDFVGLRNGTLCDKETATRILNIKQQELKTDDYREIDSSKIKAFIN